MSNCEHLTHYIKGHIYIWRTDMGKLSEIEQEQGNTPQVRFV